MFGYDVIVADPPWLFELRSEAGIAKSPQAHYSCMPTKDICALPVDHLAGGDCWLFLWVTAPMLEDGLRVMRAWRFDYVTTMAWHKVFRSGKNAIGTGYVVRSMHENILIGKMGNPGCAKPMPSLFTGIRRENSRKPDEFFALVERFKPRARRLDLFSRETRPGWTNWGDEKTKFDMEPANDLAPHGAGDGGGCLGDGRGGDHPEREGLFPRGD